MFLLPSFRYRSECFQVADPEHGGGSLWDRCAGGGRRPRGQTAHQGGPLRQGALVDLVLGRLDAWLT